ncbi:putative secreted protein (Por secretion system target) [Tumebacillus sp. BK434]|uniref:M4 family metallopeptidase n=1 Tax=Tumebacillus sp. BK434 TaxID=2512169 RepID=UPI0010E43B8D|nr:M4 family metallopeptidase [Tumebacillus sp. BK434]TCP58136.1 putative secreted protein (Por secretion system target) [Tumebacillus sp. BK434]
MSRMNKVTAFAVLSSMVLALSVGNASAAPVGKDKGIDKKVKQVAVMSKISKDSKGTEKITWNEKKGVPNFVQGKMSDKKLRNTNDAVAILEENKALFDMESASNEVNLMDESVDELGMKMFKFQQTYQGIPVFGNEVIVHADKNGVASSINGYYDPEVKRSGLKTKVKLTADEAIAAAKADTGLANIEHFDIAKSDKYFYQSKNGAYHLVYLVTLSTLEGAEPAYWDVFVDAQNGKIVDKLNKVYDAHAVGSGKGVLGATRSLNTDSYTGGYYLRDITKPMYSTGGKIETYSANYTQTLPGTLMTDSDNNWNDPAAVDAHYHSGIVYDYYKNKHNRNSFDGNGATLKSTVHYDRNYANAFWNGTQMVYGDGDGSTFTALSAGLDVVGHEITHAVTERTANLTYSYQSGALNESWSDALGNLIENKADDLWQVGEDIYTPNTPNDAMRSMSNPGLNGNPAHMNDYVNTSSDNGGVHTNSGIPNKAFYNFVTTSGITRDNAGKVWYRALTQYMTSNSQFMDARNATIQAATDLFGASSAEVTAVTNAWSNVGVGSSAGNTNDSYEPNESMSAAYGPITSGTVYNGKISTATDQDWFKFNINTTGTISVTLNNLPNDYDLYLYNSAGTEVAKSENTNTTSESISYSATATGTYYVKVNGHNGAMNTSTAYALKATYPTSSSSVGQWYYESMMSSTPHPYANYATYAPSTYTKIGATQVALHFSYFDTEQGYDFVTIKDKNGSVIHNLSGTLGSFWVIVDGDKISAQLISDLYVNAWGYSIDQVAYFSSNPLFSGSTITTVDPIIGN